MSKSLNKIMLIGNVGSDPEVRKVGDGQVANFSLATNRIWTDASGTKREKVQWHRCNAWGKQAVVIEQYVKKGDRLYIEGEMEYGSYEKDGHTQYTADVKVWNFIMLGSTEQRAPSSAAPADLPF